MNDDSRQHLVQLGWDTFFEKHFQDMKMPDSAPGRVVSESKGSYQISSQFGVLDAKISGKMRYRAGEERQHPAVGDWVIVKPLIDEQKGIIHGILPRKSKFSRKVAGERTQEQVVSANVDTIFVVSGLDGGRNLNLRRIERYLTLAWNSGATPVIVLNKADLCPEVEESVRKVETIAGGVSIHAVSAKERRGLGSLRHYLTIGSTVAFLGSSGVGKSALINTLLGVERQDTAEVRGDDRVGRHTTTKRELIVLPDGGMVIDTPGMREIQLWAGEDDLQGVFSDIELLAKECRFNDCSHRVESGCAVLQAVDNGVLDQARVESYQKLQNELAYLAGREELGARLYEKAKWKKIHQWAKEIERESP